MGIEKMKRLLFIYNAKSGTGAVAKRLSDIIDVFVKSGYRVEAYPTQCVMDAKKQIMERSHEFDLIVCSGGDGTLNEVVSGVMQLEDKPVIGYIPTGSTNDFAGSIGLKKNMLLNAQIAVGGCKYKVDVGTFNEDRNFVYVVAFGAFTKVSYATPQRLKNVIGHPAYLIEAIKSLPTIKSYHMRFEFDGNVIEDDFIYGIKGLTGKDVILDDGLYELTLVKMPKNVQDLTGIAQGMLNSKIESEYVYRYKVSEVKAYSAEPVGWTVDGECGGTHKSVTIKNNPNAVTIMGAKKR